MILYSYAKITCMLIRLSRVIVLRILSKIKNLLSFSKIVGAYWADAERID